jgi:hypothetical protein
MSYNAIRTEAQKIKLVLLSVGIHQEFIPADDEADHGGEALILA